MAWRFKASKFKNAAPIVPKPEACVRDICVGSYQTYGNNIAASAAFMAFNVDHNGSSLAVLPVGDCGRKSKTMPLLHAHSDTVTDVAFSPFHDGLLATGSQDCLVKVWTIPAGGLSESLSSPECVFSHRQRRVETVAFHPTADGLLSTSSYTSLMLWDLSTQQETFSNASEHGDVIQAVSWKRDGSLIATSCKDKQVRVGDPRTPKFITHCANSHQSIKDSRVAWLGDTGKLLTTGFDSGRQREVYIRDLRNFEEANSALVLDSSTGVLMPLFDADTGMLFLAAKGDTSILFLELLEREPWVSEGLRHTGEQTKGACLVPKRALQVMQGEVNRLLQLTSNAVIPITYQVPRKSYRDFHADLFPDTPGTEAPLSAAQWMAGKDSAVARVSLDPVKASAAAQVHRGSLAQWRMRLLERHPPSVKGEANKMGHKMDGHAARVMAHQNGSAGRRLAAHQNGSYPVPAPTPTLAPAPTPTPTLTPAPPPTSTPAPAPTHASAPSTIPAPPKPLPRSVPSRAGSLAETDEPPKPAARPRPVATQASNPTPAPTLLATTDPTPTPSPAPATVPSDHLPGTVAAPPPVVTSVNPIATTGSYKPRLGPKPFTPPKLSFGSGGGDRGATDFSFDKVFHVPTAPGAAQPQPLSSAAAPAAPAAPAAAAPAAATAPAAAAPAVATAPASVVANGASPPSPPSPTAVAAPSAFALTPDDVEDEKPKTPSTAERRRIFEQATTPVNETPPTAPRPVSAPAPVSAPSPAAASVAAPEDDVALRPRPLHTSAASDEAPAPFERGGQRASIAERRRLYEEGLAASGTAGAGPSPTPLRRRDSAKRTVASAAAAAATATSAPAPEEEAAAHVAAPATAPAPVPTPATKPEPATTPTPKRTSTVFGRVSKFRHLKGTPMHKSTHVENVRNVSRQVSGECDGFRCNAARVALPLAGAGGKLALLELRRPGRLPDGVTPALLHASAVMDFAFDPFDDARIAVACDDGTLRLWRVPEGGLVAPTNEPEATMAVSAEKLLCLAWHPLAQGVLAVAAFDHVVRVWDVDAKREAISLEPHPDQVLALAWSPCGSLLATACRDSRVRVFDPRREPSAVAVGQGPLGPRGARLAWTLDGWALAVVGFDRASQRQVMLLPAPPRLAPDTPPLATVGLDVAPAVLVPHYDEDSSTLFLTGRGDTTIYAFEVSSESPFLCPLSHHRCPSLHQGLGFLPKNVCDVASVEFARALRLTNSTIEPLSFTVPRVKTDLFQDDLFPPTKVIWKPSMSAEEWLSGENHAPARISLQPEGMDCLSAVQGTPGAVQSSVGGKETPKTPVPSRWSSDTAKEKQEQIQRAVSSRMEVNMSLEQDQMEGVDEREWDD